VELHHDLQLEDAGAPGIGAGLGAQKADDRALLFDVIGEHQLQHRRHLGRRVRREDRAKDESLRFDVCGELGL